MAKKYTYHEVVDASHEAVDGETGKPCGVMVKAVHFKPSLSCDLTGMCVLVEGEWVRPPKRMMLSDIFKPGVKLRLPDRG